MIYISGFVLVKAIAEKNILRINSVLIVLRKMFTSFSHQKITTYMPSYLFAKEIGFLSSPFCHEVIYKMLLQFFLELIEQ